MTVNSPDSAAMQLADLVETLPAAVPAESFHAARAIRRQSPTLAGYVRRGQIDLAGAQKIVGELAPGSTAAALPPASGAGRTIEDLLDAVS